MSSLRILTTATLAAAAFAATASVHAISYDATTAPDPVVAPTGATFSVPAGDSLGTKSQAGFKVLGVAGGAAGSEIDAGEWLKITFSTPQIVDTLILGLLFDGPEYADPDERAIISVNNGASVNKLQAVDFNKATWNGALNPAVVVNLSTATGSTDAAVWKLINPFGNLAVTSIKLYPDYHICGSDFGLVGFTTHNVPDTASTLSLLGMSILGLAFIRRRARA